MDAVYQRFLPNRDDAPYHHTAGITLLYSMQCVCDIQQTKKNFKVVVIWY
jgi:hypothetical protein